MDIEDYIAAQNIQDNVDAVQTAHRLLEDIGLLLKPGVSEKQAARLINQFFENCDIVQHWHKLYMSSNSVTEMAVFTIAIFSA
jgi:hypothetical protein